MSQPDQPKKAGATFVWVLGAFAGFAVLFIIIQSITDSKQGFDPREQERRDFTAEILKAQSESIAKLGLNDETKKNAVFTKTLAALGAKKPGVSTQVVPGSPTQLKQAAAAAPAPAAAAPAAPAPAPAAPSNPAPPIPTTFVPSVPAAPAGSAPPIPAVPAAPAPAPAAPASPK
ncbi:MAG: hypothetical protein ACYC67_04520 [Prosthecobacter sp.]